MNAKETPLFQMHLLRILWAHAVLAAKRKTKLMFNDKWLIQNLY